MKKEIKNPEPSVEDTIEKQWKPIVSVVKNILLTKKIKQNRLMLLLTCAVCGKEKSTFIKKNEL